MSPVPLKHATRMRLRIAARCDDCEWLACENEEAEDVAEEWANVHQRVVHHAEHYRHDVVLVKEWLYGPPA